CVRQTDQSFLRSLRRNLAIDPTSAAVAGQERIGAPLVAKGAAWAVAADEGDIFSARQELGLDGGDQRFMVAAGQIGTPDGAAKQDIADMGEALLVIQIDDVPGRMARAMQHFEFVP